MAAGASPKHLDQPVTSLDAGRAQAESYMKRIAGDATCYAVGAQVYFDDDGGAQILSLDYLFTAKGRFAYCVAIDNRKREMWLKSSGEGLSDLSVFKPLAWERVQLDVADLPPIMESNELLDVLRSAPDESQVNLCWEDGRQTIGVQTDYAGIFLDAESGEVIHHWQ